MHSPTMSTIFLSLIAGLAPSIVSGSTMPQCDKIRIDNHNFDLSKLGGAHSVVTTRYEPSTEMHINTTYSLDICQPLKKTGNVDKKSQCPTGTRVCAISHELTEKEDTVNKVVAIAGALEDQGGTTFETEITRTKNSDSNTDSQKEGLRIIMMGGKYPLVGPVKERRKQRAVIEFWCDPREGTEGEWDAEDKYKDDKRRQPAQGSRDEKKDDGDEGKNGDSDGDNDGESSIEHQLMHENATLIWNGYGDEEGADVLRLTWYTKYACENYEDDGGSGDESGNGSWGFFTWLVIIVFLGTAAYLIFGSWLNYTRYGARGWDLLPHGDTIRDIPYLFKDWIRRLLNTVQGAGSRGGYSAV